MSQVVCHPLPLPSIDIYANTPCLLQSISSIDCLISTVSRQAQLSTILPVAVGVVIRSRYTAVRKTLTLPAAGRGVCRARYSPPHKPAPLGKRPAYNDPVICTPVIISTVRSKFHRVDMLDGQDATAAQMWSLQCIAVFFNCR